MLDFAEVLGPLRARTHDAHIAPDWDQIAILAADTLEYRAERATAESDGEETAEAA